MQAAAVIDANHETFAVQWYVDGVRISKEIGWNELLTVTAFKRDLALFDLICLGIRTVDGLIEIDEEDPLWEDWIAKATEMLPGMVPWSEWFTSVAFPAFTTNERVIFTSPQDHDGTVALERPS
ncbi:hypothetical protein [Luteolibacter sp. LG18]|uniref:hypothetical protein n=1 Tax=Luteolibacter sp. LG18 TaxID=2819286 RepID=UPI002B283331|nr:hypothetical protein llg_06350 [Luteolibacter sp. LG18]